jgi:hypothetical protein
MSVKIYKSALGRVVDLGALMLENENTRAVGNMGVNARGDIVDGANRVVETRNKQVQKHYKQQVTTNTASVVPTVSTRAAKKQQAQQQAQQKASKAKVAKAAVPPVTKEKIVNDSVLDVYNDERLVSNFDKMPDTAPVVEVDVPEIESATPVEVDIPEIESMEELAELEAAIPELPQDPIKSIPRGGLAAAIAKAQTVKQELLKTPRQAAQARPGVNKI